MPKKSKKEPLVPKDPKNLHVKPTKEELDANAEKALKEAEEIKGKPVLEEENKKEPSKPEEEKETKKTPDYKEKYVNSAKEAYVLNQKNRKTNEALEKAMETPEPSEEELQKEFSDWEVMSEFEKKMAKDSLQNTRRFQALEEITKENKDLAVWQKKVDKFVDDPQTLIDNPKLEGREDEFKLFAMKPTRRNMDFDTLKAAFLYDASIKPSSKKKGSMFESGTGGPTTKGKPASNKISVEEARDLRKHDYKKYSQYLREGKIEEPEF